MDLASPLIPQLQPDGNFSGFIQADVAQQDQKIFVESGSQLQTDPQFICFCGYFRAFVSGGAGAHGTAISAGSFGVGMADALAVPKIKEGTVLQQRNPCRTGFITVKNLWLLEQHGICQLFYEGLSCFSISSISSPHVSPEKCALFVVALVGQLGAAVQVEHVADVLLLLRAVDF